MYNLTRSCFPRLTIETLQQLTFGVYQLHQAKSYTSEHLSEDGKYIMFVGREWQDMICVRMKSRHVSSKAYHIWVQFETNSINGWYCTCPNGTRTVGCCAHIAAALWFLGYSRHHKDVKLLKSWPKNLLNAAELDEADLSE